MTCGWGRQVREVFLEKIKKKNTKCCKVEVVVSDGIDGSKRSGILS